MKDKGYLAGQAISAEDKGIKSLAGGLRKEVGIAEPTVLPSMKEQSELINVLKVAGPQVSREGNKNIVGLGWLSPSMARTMGFMLDRYPWFKSYAAQQLHVVPEALPGLVSGAATAAAQGSFNAKTEDYINNQKKRKPELIKEKIPELTIQIEKKEEILNEPKKKQKKQIEKFKI